MKRITNELGVGNNRVIIGSEFILNPIVIYSRYTVKLLFKAEKSAHESYVNKLKLLL